jgi:hypothetical protein
MARRAVKRRAGTRAFSSGKKDAFAPAQVKQIRRVLADQGVAGLRDLVLFAVAIDTMLPGPNPLIKGTNTIRAMARTFT